MDFELKKTDAKPLPRQAVDTALVFVDDRGITNDGHDLSRIIGAALATGGLQAEVGQCLSIWQPPLKARRLLLLHAGDGSPRQIKKAFACAAVLLKQSAPGSVALASAQPWQTGALRSAMLALADAAYVYAATVSKPKPSCVTSATAYADGAAMAEEFRLARAEITGILLARQWADRPANHCTPSHLADAAKALVKGCSQLSCEVMGPKEVEKLGMGAFLSVAKGAQEPLRLIVLHYRGVAKKQAPVVLVGKGITFDSGGICLKQASGMDEMKFDMSGAASVLGVFAALRQCKPALNAIGLIPACENMPGGRATHPGDVVTSLSGQTIEILNTDAEGRLILCDALTYAQRFKPQAVIDIATLTGACMIALGAVRSGLFASDDALAKALISAGESADDLCWRMPLDDDYAQGLKTSFADIANVASGRAAGAITAAKFLHRFAPNSPWAHLDIAGTAWKEGANKGATGRPVGLLLHYLLAQQGHVAQPPRKPAQKARS